MMKRFSQEQINNFVELQLINWPLAKKNYDALGKCQRRKFRIGDLEGAWQYNPARIGSTGADISAKAVSERPCFLCRDNRPKEQMAIPVLPGWELLVNPYPIFPIHFTLAATSHIPQDKVPLDIVLLAEMLEGMTVFFNGPHAGASAPDHSHLQAVLTDELPLMRLIESRHAITRPGIFDNATLGLDLPFNVISAVITPDDEGCANLQRMIADNADGKLNFYSFIDRKGYLRMIRIERQKHRPSCYGSKDEYGLMVSPGSIDMAGIIILPRSEDFEKINIPKTVEIYRETGKPAQESPGD